MTPEELVKTSEKLYTQGRVDDAVECLRQATTLDPSLGVARSHLGYLLQQQGLFDEAIENYEEALRLDSNNSLAYLGIVSCKRIGAGDEDLIGQMELQLREGFQSADARSNMHYALGRAYDSLGAYEKAIDHFDEANWIMGTQPVSANFEPEAIRRRVAWAMETFNKKTMTELSTGGSDSPMPIFIVGMIRSGTTLVEQILSSHPEVTAGGELLYWRQREDQAFMRGNGSPPARSTITEMASGYNQLLQAIAKGGSRVTDKAPFNLFSLGLIRAAFPNAVVLHCRRLPVDTCLSIYTTPFRRALDFAHRRRNIVFFFKEYLRLMEHWRSVIPEERFLEVDYSDLVSNTEDATRRMVAFCGLKWDDACLKWNSNTRRMTTPSMWQARQGAYKSSLDRWKNYKPWLGSLEELL